MKFRYLVVFAALAFMASCSNQENAQPASVPAGDEEAWVYDESLPVPVMFTTPQITVQSKAAVNDMVGLEVGVFGLDRTGHWGEATSENVLMYNTKATVSSRQDRGLTFSPQVYYPMTNDVNFNFYGYYPYSADVAYENSRRYEVTYENIGTIDILWAKEVANQISDGINTYEGFNARYVRKAIDPINNPNALPSLVFEHLLTGMKFSVRLAEPAVNIRFKGLTLTNIQPNATLRIADYMEPETWEGVVVGEGTPGTIQLKKDSDGSTDFSSVGIGTIAASLGATLMLVPAEFYTAEIYLTVDGEDIAPVPVTLTREGGFVKGEMYSMTILIQNPEQVVITSSLTPWTEVEGEEIVIGE